jgi:hypothetical protein
MENNVQKKCSKCKQTKPIDDFYEDKRHKDNLASCCKVCENQRQAKYRKTEKGKEARAKYKKTDKGREAYKRKDMKYRKSEKGKEAARRRSKKQMAEKPYRFWATSTLGKHRKRGNEILISIDELEILAKQSTHCKICGCKLSWGYGNGLTTNSPTLDRIDNENIISIDSIQILCHSCNSLKLNRTMKEMLQYCKNFVKKFENLKD